MSNLVVEYAVGPNVGASWSRYGHADIGAGIWKAGNVGSVVQRRVFGEIVNDEDVLGVVRRGGVAGRESREIDADFATGNVAGNHSMAHCKGVSWLREGNSVVSLLIHLGIPQGRLTPKLITGFIGLIVLEREAASRLRHAVGIVDVEEKDEATASLHAQGPKLTKSCQGLVGTRHRLVLLAGLRISHVREDRSILGHLFERAIVLVELFFSPALAGRGSARATGARHGLVAPRKIRVMWLCRRVRFVVDYR